MRKKGTQRIEFGLSQEQMATLLKVTPGQWAMYESGKRDLPSRASVLYSNLLAEMYAAKPQKAPKIDPAHEAKVLEDLLYDNSRELHFLGKKMAAAEKKYSAHLNRERLADVIDNREARKAEDRIPGFGSDYLRALSSKTSSEKLQLQLLRFEFGRKS